MKKWYRSKTFWVNLIGIGAIILQCEYGFIIEPEHEVMILGLVNLILRLITKEGLEFKKCQQ